LKTAVVILNYNGKKFLEDFLPTVIQHSKTAAIYVADNCSTDDSVAYLKAEFPEVNIIINSSNGGFATGYNQALSQIKSEYYVLLNSDIEVTENWLEPCIELLDKQPEIAAVQPKILSFKRKSTFEHAGAAGGFLDKNFYPFCQGRIFEEVEEDLGQYDENKEVFWATGACLFIRSEVYHKMGGLDDDFFAHMEEIDLCWRIKKTGHQIYYCAKSQVYHVGGGTLDYMNPKKTYLNFRNSLYMIAKNYEGNLLLKMLHRLLLDGVAAILFIIKFKFSHFKAVFMAHMHFYRDWSVLKKKRQEIKKISTNFNSVGLYKRSILVMKFLRGIKSFKSLKSEDFNS